MIDNHIKQLKFVLEQHEYINFLIKKDEYGRFNGIIFDRNEKKYFIKAVIGKNSYKYKSLYAEAKVTQYLSVRTKKLKINYKGFRFRIPSVEEIIVQGEILCLITKYFDGKKLLTARYSTQVNVLLTTLELVDKLSKDPKLVAIRPYLKCYTRELLLISLPFRFIKAVISSPFVFPKLLRAFLRALLGISLGSYEYGLVHSDINLSNIIFHKNFIYLTDWEEAGWGISSYNTISPLCIHWFDPRLRLALLGRLQDKRERSSTFSVMLYRTLVLFNQHMGEKDKKRTRDTMLLRCLECM